MRRKAWHGQGLGFHVAAARRFALFLAALGRYEEAAYHLDMTYHIDPFSNRQKAARARFLHITRRFEEGLRQLSKPLIYGPLPMEARFLLALMSAHLGNKGQAKQLIEGFRPASGVQLSMMAGIAEVLALSGELDEAHKIARDFKLLSLDSSISRFWPDAALAGSG